MILKYIHQKLDVEYQNLSLWYFVSFMFGIIYFFENNYRLSLHPSLLIAAITIALIFYFKNKNIIVLFCLNCMLMFLIGIIISENRVSSVKTHPINKMIVSEITGEIINIKPSLKGRQITIANIINNSDNLSKVRINISDQLTTEINQGDIISLKAKLFPLTNSVLPYSFDFGFYMYLDGVDGSGYALTAPVIIEKKINKLQGFIHKIRMKIYQRLVEVLGAAEGNFVAAILIGETKAIPVKISQNMRDTGVAHILSVSGLHLSLVAMIFFTISRALLNCSNFLAYNFNVKIIAACISIMGSFLYLQISGNNIAATRAFIMTAIFMTSVILGRSIYPMRSVVCAAFLILLFLPEYILHPSFQLSFTAVLCLISGYELYMRNSQIFGRTVGIISSIKMYIFTNIYTSFLASIITAPYVIYHFYKFANYSVLMNLIAVPLMSFFMMPLALLSLFLMPLGIDLWVLKFLSFFVSIVINSADYITQLPFAVWYVGYISPFSLIIFTLGFFFLCFWQTKVRYAGFLLGIVSLTIMFFSPKPDFIYDHNSKIIGIKNQHNKLEIFTQNKMPFFMSDYWVTWYGQQEINIKQMDIARTDMFFKMQNNKTVSLSYTDCMKADVIIITSKKLHCDNAKQIINFEDIKKYRQVLIFCHNNILSTIFGNNNLCEIKFAKEKHYE